MACLQFIIMLYRWWVVMDILYWMIYIIVEHGHISRVERTYKKKNFKTKSLHTHIAQIPTSCRRAHTQTQIYGQSMKLCSRDLVSNPLPLLSMDWPLLLLLTVHVLDCVVLLVQVCWKSQTARAHFLRGTLSSSFQLGLFQINLPPRFCSPPQLSHHCWCQPLFEIKVLLFADIALFYHMPCASCQKARA